MRKTFSNMLAAAMMLVPAIPSQAQESAPETAAAGKLSSDSTIGALLASPGAKAVLEKHAPALVSSPQIGQAMGMTLKAVAGYPQAGISAETLQAIEADLAKL